MNNQPAIHRTANRLTQVVTLALGLAIWPSLSPAEWSVLGSYNPLNGRPNGMTQQSTSLIPSDISIRINRLLGAEGRNIASNPETQALLTDDLGGNLFLTKNANIKVVFLAEDAGYENSIGFFKFNKTGLPRPAITGEKIIFPNASTPNPLGFGDTVDLGDFSAGDAIGFTVVANGWSGTLQRVRPDRPATVIFRTIKGLNPEREPRNAHTVLLSNPENRLLVLAMEDLNRENSAFNDRGYRSDDDFNDIFIAILVEPFDALDVTHIVDVDTGTTSENPTDPGGDGGTRPLISSDPGGAADTKPIGVSGRQSWRENSEER